MNLTSLVGRLLGLENVRSIDRIDPSFAAPWAHNGPAWVVFGCAGLAALAMVFYLKYQHRGRRRTRAVLGIARAILLCALFVILAEPILVVRLTNSPRPLLWVLFDGTDSMAIEDRLPEAERKDLAAAVGLIADTPTSGTPVAAASRADYVRALVAKKEANLLAKLDEKFRLRTFLFDRADGVRSLETSSAVNQNLDPQELAGELTTSGQVTALGAALSDLGRRHATGHLAGLLVVSDFDQNSGPAPLASARKLGAPIYTLGIGPKAAVDLQVDLSAPLLMKKAERGSLVATLRQNGLEGRTVTLKLTARRLGGPERAAAGDSVTVIGEKSFTLSGPSTPVEIPFTPTETGRFQLIAEADPLEGEVARQNNRAVREVNIRDDFLRLLFVEYEPTWEWRFIKEVFHRDKLVGMRGFRTFLRSADPKVRQTNELFLPTLTPKRSEFFANDVIFLGDMPGATLSPRFCEMTKEFVSKFGGGLVVVAGPRFGPGQLAGTPLADMLPAVIDPESRARDQRGFRPRLTPSAAAIDFMQLGSGDAENARAWDNLGRLPWYQPAARLHPLATVLLEHPTDTCLDGRTPQPLVAIRRYGRGEVVYLAFNETWRLRRRYGELYYRQFWGQMIHRLGLSHALGTQKRFVVRTDRQQYQADDKVTLTVEAYDANFEPLAEDKLPDRRLSAELTTPANAAGNTSTQPVSIPQLREGVFEARIPVFAGGEHRVRVKDPITGEQVEVHFQVTSVSAERRSAVCNTALAQEIASATGGKAYGLANVSQLADDIQATPRTETTISVFPLWNTWACFGLVVFLMLSEWLVRKRVNLP
ncbi:MAG: hypothetical protein ACYC35_17165 [Pirellulales bacterium]